MKKGFTLIELLVVISIIGFLSSIILASFNSSRDKGRAAGAASQIRQYMNVLSIYYSDTGRLPPACTSNPVCDTAPEDGLVTNSDMEAVPAAVPGWRGPYSPVFWSMLHPWGGRYSYIPADANCDGVKDTAILVLDNAYYINGVVDGSASNINLAAMLALNKIFDGDASLTSGKVQGTVSSVVNIPFCPGVGDDVDIAQNEMVIMFEL